MKLYISLGRMGILIVLLSSSHDYDSNICLLLVGFPGSSNGKESACNAGDLGLTPGSGRSFGEGNGNSLQYSCLENSMDQSVQFSSVTQSCLTLCDPMNHSTPGLPVYHHLPEFTQTHVHRVGDAIQPSYSLSSPSPPALNVSQHQDLFQLSWLHIRWSKYWSFSCSISPSNEYSGLISFRIDWLDLLAV